MLSVLKKRNDSYIMILPVLLFLLTVYGYPLILTFKYSFQAYFNPNTNTFVGLNNFKAVLMNSKFYGTILLTAKWTALTVALKIGIGFIFALLLNSDIYLLKLNRFLLLIPWAIPQVVVAILWSWILDGQYGYLNYYFTRTGMD